MKRAAGKQDYFKACYVPDAPGLYNAHVSAGGVKSGKEPFAVEVSREEYFITSMNEAFLTDVAKKSGGMFVAEKDVKKLIGELERPGRMLNVRMQAELWRAPWCWYALGIIAFLLSIEWFVRRRGGLV